MAEGGEVNGNVVAFPDARKSRPPLCCYHVTVARETAGAYGLTFPDWAVNFGRDYLRWFPKSQVRLEVAGNGPKLMVAEIPRWLVKARGLVEPEDKP